MRSVSLVCILFAVLFSSCSKQSEPKSTHQLRMNVFREPFTLDPRQGSELVGSTMHFILYEGLMRLNPDDSVTPAQAKSVIISDDRKTYTFQLRGTKWSDGTKVTAKDFEYAWKKILTPHFPAMNVHLLYPIKNAELAKKGEIALDKVGVHAIDDKTLVVELEHPTPYFLHLVAFCVFFPVNHAIDVKNPHWMNDASPEFTTNGPFKLAGWKHNNEITLEKNPYYWEAAQIDLDKIHVSMIANESTALHMYENNQLDIIGLGYSPLPSDSLMQCQQTGEMKTQLSPGTSVVCFNVEKFPFNNKNIRKAFSYAINRQEIVDNVTQLGEAIATNIIPPSVGSYGPHTYFKDHDVENAQRCFQLGLDELGITAADFPRITYYYSHNDLNHKLAQILQQQWTQIFGIEISLQNTEHKMYIDRLGNRNYDIAQSFWISQYHDPMSILERFKYKTNAKNYPGWEHPEYIRLLEKSALDRSPEARIKTLEAAEALFLDEMPLAPIYHWKSGFMIKDHLTYQVSPVNGMFELTRIYFKESIQ
jgi:oligopeptide transport system substrate-binding protein